MDEATDGVGHGLGDRLGRVAESQLAGHRADVAEEGVEGEHGGPLRRRDVLVDVGADGRAG